MRRRWFIPIAGRFCDQFGNIWYVNTVTNACLIKHLGGKLRIAANDNNFKTPKDVA